MASVTLLLMLLYLFLCLFEMQFNWVHHGLVWAQSDSNLIKLLYTYSKVIKINQKTPQVFILKTLM